MSIALSMIKRFHLVIVSVVLLAMAGCGRTYNSDETPDDEAMKRLHYQNEHSAAKRTPEEAAEEFFLPEYYYNPDKPDGQGVTDYFPGMDRIVVARTWKTGRKPPLDTPVFQLLDKRGQPNFRVETMPLRTNKEILGRNTWMLWCGGNEGFWDWLGTDSFGFIDLLKLIDSRKRSERFDKGGLINEPEMMQSGGPDAFGLWLDMPVDSDTRQWRNTYLTKAFDSIRVGQHKSQQGLLDSKQESSYTGDSYGSSSESSRGESTARSEMKAGVENDADDDKYNSKYPPPEIYGVSTGVVGLRLFPNPYFDATAQKKWDAKRYYEDPEYWNDPKLVRPYRVGVACAYCHASFHPLNPPRDVTNPSWENLSGNIGAQYLRIRVAFGNLLKPDNFVYHLLDSQPPGTIDTSLIASDNINNTNAMNSVFNLTQRALLSLRNPHERISASGASQPSLWDPEHGDQVPAAIVDLFKDQELLDEALNSNSHPERRVPRILLDGSDSIGAWGALARVYLNIGTYWEQWRRLHRTVVGFQPQRPFTIADCDRHSVYWHATQDRVSALRDYFLKVSPPMPLLATEKAKERIEPINVAKLRGQAKLEKQELSHLLARAKALHVDVKKLKDGRKVFVRYCIVCHSSIQPESSAVTFFRTPAERDGYRKRFAKLIAARNEYRANDTKTGEFWEHDPARWLGDAEYIAWADDAVERPEFWKLNYLSTDYRVPISLVKTNAGRAMATNALDKNMWDDFASESYQRMPSVGAIEYFNPYDGPDGKMDTFSPRHKVRNRAQQGGGGPGFYRVPTLVSIWTTAPLLHNNSLGTFNNDPSIDGRLEAFDDAIRKLLWPQRRLESSSYNDATPERLKRDHGLIWRTPRETSLIISGRRIPTLLGQEVTALMQLREDYPWLQEIRPLWLPSSILLLASFLLLVLDSQKHRHRVGITALILSALGLAICLANANWGWFAPLLEAVSPLLLLSVLLLVLGLLFLVLDRDEWLRRLAYAIFLVAVIGFLLHLVGDKLAWLAALGNAIPLWLLFQLLFVGVLLRVLDREKRLRKWAHLVLLVTGVGFVFHWFGNLLTGVSALEKSISLSWLVLALIFGAAIFYLLTTRWSQLRRYAAIAVVALAAVALLAAMLNANWGWHSWSHAVGPIWVYALFLIAAAVVLFAPNQRQLVRYFGYSTLVLSLSVGLVIYFLDGRLGDLTIGPIPKGTPVNLLANANPDADPKDLIHAFKVTVGTLAEIKSKNLKADQAEKLMREKVAPALMKVNKCPDFVMDRGHYYDWFRHMTDDDKEALIELLKTF